jgi:hypothetical protein
MTAHKHAALMAQYAQDAMETETPWERWQYRYPTVSWAWKDAHADFSFLSHVEYRRKPKVIMINGFEVPEPMREAPEMGTKYWVAANTGNEPQRHMWDGEDMDLLWLRCGIVHATREAAELHIKVLHSFTEVKK